jgi:hypothetical protein
MLSIPLVRLTPLLRSIRFISVAVPAFIGCVRPLSCASRLRRSVLSRIAQVFPVSASKLPTLKTNKSVRIWNSTNNLTFCALQTLTPCFVLALFPFLGHFPGRLYVCTLVSKLPLSLSPNQISLSHSKRRISTGNSREASLAGSSVATVAIPNAARAIQAPSTKLG